MMWFGKILGNLPGKNRGADMINLLWVLLIPLIVSLVAKKVFHRTITTREIMIVGSVISVLTVFAWVGITYSNVHDTQILNGVVLSKSRTNTQHEESYSCNCRIVKSGNSETTVCDTCWRTVYDVFWDCNTSLGSIRIDSDSSDYRSVWKTPDPKRYTDILIGEPAAVSKTYINYIKASPSSMFNKKLSENDSKYRIPEYPEVYDFYRVNHAINVNSKIPNLKEWNDKLGNALISLGPKKQVNVLAVFVSGFDRSYTEVLEKAWIGGKKNDLIIVFGLDGTKIDWVDGFAFGKSAGNHKVLISLRDDLQEVGDVVKVDEAIGVIRTNVESTFVRKPMSEFKYLESNAFPSASQIMWLIGVMLVFLGIGTFIAVKYDF